MTADPSVQFSSVQFSYSVLSDSLEPQGLQHARLPCPSPTPGAYSDSCPSHQLCHATISSPVVLFSSCCQSFPASGSIQMSQFSASGGQSVGASASASVLPMNIQDWFPLGWTGLNSLQSKGLSRVFSNTTVQKHQLSGAQLSLQSNSHIHIYALVSLLFFIFHPWSFQCALQVTSFSLTKTSIISHWFKEKRKQHRC